MRGRTRRVTALLVTLAAIAALAACQTSAVGRRCRANTVAQDATYVLRCVNGRFARWMSKADGLRLLAAIQAQQGATSTTVPPRQGVAPIQVGDAPPPGAAWGAVNCYDGNDSYPDVWWVGPEDTAGNLRGSNSQNGSCTQGAEGYALTAVRANSLGEAVAKCLTLNGLGDAFNLPTAGYAFPLDAWGCR